MQLKPGRSRSAGAIDRPFDDCCKKWLIKNPHFERLLRHASKSSMLDFEKWTYTSFTTTHVAKMTICRAAGGETSRDAVGVNKVEQVIRNNSLCLPKTSVRDLGQKYK